MNLNIYEVIEAAKTKGFGFSSFYQAQPRGHCIPVDPFYLVGSQEFDVQAKFIGCQEKLMIVCLASF